MYHFYNINRFSEQPLSVSEDTSISLDVNLPLTNNIFYSLFEAYYRNPSEETEDALGLHINTIDYLIGILPNDASSAKTLTINKMDDLNYLICTTEDREVFLPAFTDSRELSRWYSEPVYALKVPAAWLWKFVLQQKNFNGIVINPGSIGWDLSLEHIASLLNDLNL